jgi:hypothetical protein
LIGVRNQSSDGNAKIVGVIEIGPNTHHLKDWGDMIITEELVSSSSMGRSIYSHQIVQQNAKHISLTDNTHSSIHHPLG